VRFATLAALALSLLAARADRDLTTIKLNGMDCGPEGTATSPGGKALNQFKNRFQEPKEDDFDPDVSLAALLAPGYDANRCDPKKAATVRGYVVRVLMGGRAETCNCGATDPNERDTHIEIALARNAPPTQRVIVEVTPRGRLLNGDKWTTKALKNAFECKWVEVTGWLLFDTMHVKQAENTNPGNRTNWRATCWEIHPITAIKEVEEAPAIAATFRPSSFAALQRLHSGHLARSAKAKAATEKRNAELLKGFHAKELEEAQEEAKERQP
jgi:hypothetical protein